MSIAEILPSPTLPIITHA